MNKIKISMLDIPVPKSRVFRAGYCDLCDILPKESAQFYNCGVYGWNCDIYVNYLYDIAITTGYRNMRGEHLPSEILKKYAARGRELYENQWTDPDYRNKKDLLIVDFWRELNDYLKERATK